MELLGVALWVGDGELVARHQQAADEVGGNLLGGAGEEALGEDWEVVGGRGGYGSGLGDEIIWR